MGLRSKFLILLLSFSIVPLIALFLMQQRVFIELGDDITIIAKVLLLQTAAKELRENAENFSDNLGREFHLIENLVTMCGEEIKSTLTASRRKSTNEGIDGALATLHRDVKALHQKLASVRDHVVRLRVYVRDIGWISYPEVTDSRLMVQPGKDDESSTEAVNQAAPQWELPTDSRLKSMGKDLFAVTLPVYGTGGSRVGYLAAEVSMLKLLETVQPSSQWSLYTHSLLLQLGPMGGSENGGPVVIGKSRPSAPGPSWATAAFPLGVDTRLGDDIDALLQGLPYGKEGYVSLPYDGEKSIWAFAKANHGLGVMNILPEREILYRIARHPERLSRWLNLDSFLSVFAVVLFMVFIAAHRSKRMLEPFFELVSSFRSVSKGNFSTRLAFKAKDERQMVADAFNAMVVQIEDGIRVRQALEVAQEVQQNFVPASNPNIPGLDVSAAVLYCEETGGDYIDVLKEKETTVGIIVGDVTGHGIGAALLMASARALMRGHYQTSSELTQIMSAVNRGLAADIGDTGRFVTLFFLELDLQRHRLKWIRAGHDPAWFFSASDGSLSLLDGPGMALGVSSEYRYRENVRDALGPGDIILVGTDGIWETTNLDGAFFGKHRLESALLENTHRTAAEISAAVMGSITSFRGDAKQEDDVSLIVVKRP